MVIVINTGHIEKVSQKNMDKRYKLPGFLSRKKLIFMVKSYKNTGFLHKTNPPNNTMPLSRGSSYGIASIMKRGVD
jgi:hypothetical protein